MSRLRLRPRGFIPDIAFGREPSNSTGRTLTRVDASFSSGEPFKNISDFQSLLLRQPEVLAAHMVRQLLMYATGSEPHYSDRREIARILTQAKASNYGLRSLIDAIVQGDLFLTK